MIRVVRNPMREYLVRCPVCLASPVYRSLKSSVPLQSPRGPQSSGYRVELAGNDGTCSLSSSSPDHLVHYIALCNPLELQLCYTSVNCPRCRQRATTRVPMGDSVTKRQLPPDLAGSSGDLTLPSLPPHHTTSRAQIRGSRRVDLHSRGGRRRIRQGEREQVCEFE